MHILVEKPRRSTTAPVFFVSICKPIQQNGIFQAFETHPSDNNYIAHVAARQSKTERIIVPRPRTFDADGGAYRRYGKISIDGGFVC
jgi:hypothetical protein